jgi:hypothetical protein
MADLISLHSEVEDWVNTNLKHGVNDQIGVQSFGSIESKSSGSHLPVKLRNCFSLQITDGLWQSLRSRFGPTAQIVSDTLAGEQTITIYVPITGPQVQASVSPINGNAPKRSWDLIFALLIVLAGAAAAVYLKIKG